jgi:PIN domain nuclease of toxin-antitoxin system
MIRLDTCTLLWLVLDQSRLSESAREVMGESAGRIYVSPITAFEIGQKCARGKLELSRSPAEWFPLALRLHGLLEARFSNDP